VEHRPALKHFLLSGYHSEYSAVGENDREACSQYGAIMGYVKQTFLIGIILLVLLAIFGVLLTPDPTDDPAGVTVRLDKNRLLVTSLLVAPAISLPALTPASRIIFSRVQVATTMAKLDLICSRLC
jgi:hypothetical protein